MDVLSEQFFGNDLIMWQCLKIAIKIWTISINQAIVNQFLILYQHCVFVCDKKNLLLCITISHTNHLGKISC